jgi:hypothetical protein
MAKAKLKTTPTRKSVAAFVAAIKDDEKRKDARTLMKIMRAATSKPAKMWGPSIVGYGTYTYKYASGREGNWMVVGFSPRKAALSLYLMGGYKHEKSLLKKLGTYTTGVGCLYIKRLSDVDLPVLTKLVNTSVKRMKALTKDGAKVSC